jgi:hypothetical protein
MTMQDTHQKWTATWLEDHVAKIDAEGLPAQTPTTKDS